MGDDATKVSPYTRLDPPAKGRRSESLLRDGLYTVEAKLAPKLRTQVPGFELVLVNPNTGEHVIRTLQVNRKHPVAFATIGRHDSVDLMLGTDKTLSLRHVIVLLSLDEEGLPVARALDLRSGTGMYDISGAGHASIASNGPLGLQIGNSALFAIPWNTPLKKDPDKDLFDRITWPEPQAWVPDEAPEKHITRVTRKSKVSAMVTMPPFDDHEDRPGTPKPAAGPRVGRLKFESSANTFEMEVDMVSLRTGVLVGRYPRCDLNSEMTEVPSSVSRVHALFITLDDRVHIFDVGSTNGLTYEDFPVRVLALPDNQASRFRLTRQADITWWPG